MNDNVPSRHYDIKMEWDRGKSITKEIMVDLYLCRNMSSLDIGKVFNVSPQTVCNKIKKFGIQRRPMYIPLEFGQKFGKWTVIKKVENNSKGNAQWYCRCDCGNIGIKTTGILTSGMSKSCGCLIAEKARERCGEKHPCYVDGKTHKEGYILITKKGHPNSNKRGRILEHTYVMSEFLGRPLLPNEEVHHKNGIRDDNRLENLELRTCHHGGGARVIDMIEFCVDYLKQYAPDMLAKGEINAS